MNGAIASLWRWWRREMLALVPERWRSRREDCLALWRPGEVALWRRAGGFATPAEEPVADRLVVRLAEQKIWRRQFTLPKSARPFLRQILHNEMDRRTPWRADQVFYDVSAVAHGTALAVTLSLVPKKAVEPAVAELKARGLAADRIELCEGADPAATGAVLALADGAPVIAAGGLWPQRALAALLAAAILSLLGQAAWLTYAEARLAAARQEAAATKRLAAEVALLSRHQHFPTLRRRETPTSLAALDRLARALPDDSWAEEVQFDGGGISVAGVSADPARLLALLQAQGFQSAEFRAPVTRAEGGGQRFQIKARLAEIPHAP
jgi:general secretion pathway protein L